MAQFDTITTEKMSPRSSSCLGIQPCSMESLEDSGGGVHVSAREGMILLHPPNDHG